MADLTVKEAAAELRVCEQRVRALIQSGRLKAQRFGRAHSIQFADLDRIRTRKPGRPQKNQVASDR